MGKVSSPVAILDAPVASQARLQVATASLIGGDHRTQRIAISLRVERGGAPSRSRRLAANPTNRAGDPLPTAIVRPPTVTPPATRPAVSPNTRRMITAMVTGTGTVAFAEGRRWQHQGGGNCQDERCLAKQRHATARAVARDVSRSPRQRTLRWVA
jgi:hypothetical protein